LYHLIYREERRAKRGRRRREGMLRVARMPMNPGQKRERESTEKTMDTLHLHSAGTVYLFISQIYTCSSSKILC